MAAEAAKLQPAIEEATKITKQQLLVEMSHKADYRSYLKQLPHYLSSVRRLQLERDHLKSLVADLRHAVQVEYESISTGVNRMSAALQAAKGTVDATRRELNAQLAVEVEKMNEKAKAHAATVKDLENQVNMLQTTLAEERKTKRKEVEELNRQRNEWKDKFEVHNFFFFLLYCCIYRCLPVACVDQLDKNGKT